MAASLKRPSTRKPAVLKPSQRRSLVTQWHKSGSRQSFKAWARNTHPAETTAQVQDWFHNKRANTRVPEKCIGRTRTRVKKGGNKSQAEKNLSGR